MLKPIFGLLKVVVAAHVGAYLGDTPRHGAGTPMGVSVGPINVTLSNLVPASLVGVATGNSSIFALLSGFALSSTLGDRFENLILDQLHQ